MYVVTVMVGIGVLGAIAIPVERKADTAPVFAEMQEEIRYAVKERFLGKLIMLFGLFIFLCVPAGFLATLFVSRYYRGLKEWDREKGFLMDTFLTAQDRFKAYWEYFRISY